MDNIYENKMFCVKEAWHTKGVRVESEVMAKDAIALAKLNYRVQKVPLYAKDGDGQEIKSDFYGTINAENKKILGVVTDHYQIVQNVEAFDFFDEVVKSGEAIYHSAGALGDGERIWILAKLPKNIILFKDEVIEKYLLLTNSHNGKSSLLMYFTPIRVVCQNTLIASYKDSKEGISIRHLGNISTKVEEARRTLGLAIDFYADLEKNMKYMLDFKLSLDQRDAYFNKVLNIKDENELSTRSRNIKESIVTLSERGQGNSISEVKGTLWASYNAVTEYVDHYRSGRTNTRTESILFGSGAELKRKAYAGALELIVK